MPHLIGIQVPEELRVKIEAFRQKYARTDSEPHIGLISSRLLSDVPMVQQKMESFCLSQGDFRVTVSGQPIRQGNQIIFLPVIPGQIIMMREHLARKLGCKTSNTMYRPHVTLIRQTADAASSDLSVIYEDARRSFSEPCVFDVSQITLFAREEQQPTFTSKRVIPFTGR